MRYGRKWLVLLPYFSELIIRELKKKVEYSGLAQTKNHPCTPYLHKDQMESGETGIFSPVDHIEPAEPTDKEFPFVLSTGRRRSTYHTGTQTGK